MNIPTNQNFPEIMARESIAGVWVDHEDEIQVWFPQNCPGLSLSHINGMAAALVSENLWAVGIKEDGIVWERIER